MKRSSYAERDYAFGQAMLTLCTNIGLTQAGLADLLHISRRAVAEWEAGLSYPKAEHLKQLIALGVQQQAFAARGPILWPALARSGSKIGRIFNQQTSLSQQTLVCLLGQSEKRFSQRSSTILVLSHDAPAPQPGLPSCFVCFAEHTTAVLREEGKLSPCCVVVRKATPCLEHGLMKGVWIDG